MLKAINEAVGGDYTTGCLPKGADAAVRKGAPYSSVPERAAFHPLCR